jgi:ATP-dependent exoDNAse (exonuclease V) beta subunit
LELIQQTWLALSGHYCLRNKQSMDDVQVFFELLRANNNNKNIYVVDFFEKQLEKLFSKPKKVEDDAVQILTIHKAKGLEFDTVILPGLGRRPVAQEARLFRWEERTSLAGKKHLIFAPIKAAEQKQDPIYDFLQYTEEMRNHFELARLVYVATTRARKALFGFGNVVKDKPQANSILALLWNYLQNKENATIKLKPPMPTTGQILYRLPLEVIKNSKTISLQNIVTNNNQNLIKHDDWLRKVGTIVHKIFWQITTYGLPVWNNIGKQNLERQWTAMLLAQGIAPVKLTNCLAIIRTAVTNTLVDPTGNWILTNTNKQAKSEWAIAAMLDGELKQIVIDRTFIDEHEVRWIIDYKVCQQAEIDNIIPRHKQQLKLYKQILTMLFPDVIIKMGLYFPLQQQFVKVIGD